MAFPSPRKKRQSITPMAATSKIKVIYENSYSSRFSLPSTAGMNGTQLIIHVRVLLFSDQCNKHHKNIAGRGIAGSALVGGGGWMDSPWFLENDLHKTQRIATKLVVRSSSSIWHTP